jgi:hypothetical protein
MRRPLLKFPLAALGVILGVYFLAGVLALVDNWPSNWVALREPLWSARMVILISGCGIAGVLRVTTLHPRFATKYEAWLSGTPWRPEIELPLGPVMLVWEDLLLVLPLGVLAAVDALAPAWVPAAGYLFGYCLIAALSVKGNFWYSLSLTFAASLPVLWHQSRVVLYTVLLIAAFISQIAIHVSLMDFPWDLGDSMRDIKRRPRVGLAWPLDRVGPAAPVDPVPPVVGFACALLMGWWTFVPLKLLCSAGQGVGEVVGRTVVVSQIPVLGLVFAALRAFRYCMLYWPPISLWGRLRSGRWIIPGYDYVLISPLLMCAISIGLPRLLTSYLPVEIAGPAMMTFLVAIYFNGGPTLWTWQLTGHHRMIPGVRREAPVPRARAARM